MRVFYFAVALTAFHLINASTQDELNLETWSSQFGAVGHDDNVQNLAQTWFKNVWHQTEIDVQGQTKPDITPLFVISLPVDVKRMVLEHKENVIVVFGRNPDHENGKLDYFFVSMTNWTGPGTSASPQVGWQLTLFSRYGTIAHTQARIRSYCNSKHYNNLEWPWNWGNSYQPVITTRSCKFNVEGISITYSISRHFNEFHLLGTLSPEFDPLTSHIQADLDDLIRQDVQKRVELTQLTQLTSPFDEIFSKQLSDCLLTKVFVWKLPNYYFLHYESSTKLILQGVIVREVFGKRALLTAYWSRDINVENMSDEDKNSEVNKHRAECLRGKNPFVQEPMSDEYEQLLEQGSSLWETVDEADDIQVLSVFPMLMKNPVFLKKPIVLICVIFDFDENLLGYRYAVGDLSQEGELYCEYASEETFRSKEEVWKQITIYWNYITVPRWHLLENIFKDWQTKLLRTESQTDSAAVVDSEFETLTAATEEMIQTFELLEIRETDSDDWLVAGIYKCCENFHWVVLEVPEFTEDFKQLGCSPHGLNVPAEVLKALDDFVLSLSLFSTIQPPPPVPMKSGSDDAVVKKVQEQITSLINSRPNLSIPDVIREVKLTFYKPLFGKMIRCNCTYGDTNLVAVVHPPVENRSMNLLYLSEFLPQEKLKQKLLKMHGSESQVPLPFVEDWVSFDVKPTYNPAVDLFCEELQNQFETFLRKSFSPDPISETKTMAPQTSLTMIRDRLRFQKARPLPAVFESKSIAFDFSACADKIQEALKGLGLENEKSSINLISCRSLSPGGNWKQVVLEAFGFHFGIGLRLNQPLRLGWTAVDCCYGGKDDIMETMDDVRFNPNFLDTQEIRSSPGGFDESIKNLLKWKFEDGATTRFESARTNLGNGRVYGTYFTEVEGNKTYSGILAAFEKDKWSLIYSVTQNQTEDNVLVMLLEYESRQGIQAGVEDWFKPVKTQAKLQKILDDPTIKNRILAKLKDNSGLDNKLEDESLTIDLKLVQRQTADGNRFYFLCELRQNGTGGGSLGKFVVAFTSTPKTFYGKAERYEIQFVSRRRMDLGKTKEMGKVWTDQGLF